LDCFYYPDFAVLAALGFYKIRKSNPPGNTGLPVSWRPAAHGLPSHPSKFPRIGGLRLFCTIDDSFMEDYTINVTQIEELQTISNTDELENIFTRAKSAVVNGAKVILTRKEASGETNKFEEIDTLDDLEVYRERVFKYL
jgi:hypothetical protein